MGMKSTVMTKTALRAAIAEACEIKKSVAVTALATLATVGTGEVKKTGKFVIPGLAMIKTRKKPATKAKKMEMFGKTVLKAFAAKARRMSSEQSLMSLLSWGTWSCTA